MVKPKQNLSAQRVFRDMNQILLTGARDLVNRLKRQTRLPPLYPYIFTLMTFFIDQMNALR